MPVACCGQQSVVYTISVYGVNTDSVYMEKKIWMALESVLERQEGAIPKQYSLESLEYHKSHTLVMNSVNENLV